MECGHKRCKMKRPTMFKVGGAEKFEPFLKAYYEKFKYQSISTDTFKEKLHISF